MNFAESLYMFMIEIPCHPHDTIEYLLVNKLYISKRRSNTSMSS